MPVKYLAGQCRVFRLSSTDLFPPTHPPSLSGDTSDTPRQFGAIESLDDYIGPRAPGGNRKVSCTFPQNQSTVRMIERPCRSIASRSRPATASHSPDDASAVIERVERMRRQEPARCFGSPPPSSPGPARGGTSLAARRSRSCAAASFRLIKNVLCVSSSIILLALSALAHKFGDRWF